jgi:hypothetical protein
LKMFVRRKLNGHLTGKSVERNLKVFDRNYFFLTFHFIFSKDYLFFEAVLDSIKNDDYENNKDKNKKLSSYYLNLRIVQKDNTHFLFCFVLFFVLLFTLIEL